MFSLFGMSNFAYIARDELINDIFNFKTFLNSFLSLFPITTSAGWDGFLLPLLVVPPQCNLNWTGFNPYNTTQKVETYGLGNCGIPALGRGFFVLFVLISFLILVNMYIAIILENYEIASAEAKSPLDDYDFDEFYKLWTERYDIEAKGYIHYTQIIDLCDNLTGRLRVKRTDLETLRKYPPRLIAGEMVHCLELLCVLTKNVLAIDDEFFREMVNNNKELSKLNRPRDDQYIKNYLEQLKDDHQKLTKDSNNPIPIEEFKKLHDVWVKYEEPDSPGFIHYTKLPDLLNEVPQDSNFHIPKQRQSSLVEPLVKYPPKLVLNGLIHIIDIIESITKCVHNLHEYDNNFISKKINEMFKYKDDSVLTETEKILKDFVNNKPKSYNYVGTNYLDQIKSDVEINRQLEKMKKSSSSLKSVGSFHEV